MPHPLGQLAPVRIVIADEYPIFRDGLRRLLEADPGRQIVGEAGPGSTAVALIRQLAPDILLLGQVSGVRPPSETLRQLADAGLPVRTILLVRAIDTAEVADALQFGACGIVSKDSAADLLFQCIDSVMAGHHWVGHERSSNLAASVRRFVAARRQAQMFGLTRREQDIVRAVIDAHTNNPIRPPS